MLADDDALAQLALENPAPRPDKVIVVPQNFNDKEKRLRHHVRHKTPALFKGAVDHWSATRKWDHAYLNEVMGNKNVHVATTPNGLADASIVHMGRRYFAKPSEVLTPFASFVHAIESPRFDPHSQRARYIHYASHQNSSLTTEYVPLLQDCEASLPWADKIFGNTPVAANFWMGEDTARTTTHADLFCNMYAVVRGEKQFSLLPPQEVERLERKPCISSTWTNNGDELELRMDVPSSFVYWATVDMGGKDGAKLDSLHVTVEAGDVLYIPRFWWHAVSQRAVAAASSTVAVNFWYEFDS